MKDTADRTLTQTAQTPSDDLNQKLRPAIHPRVNHAVPVQPDAIIYQLSQAVSWLYNAKSKETAYYHCGFIAVDQQGSQDLVEKRMYFSLVAGFGLVWPRQKRITDQLTHYFAIRTEEPLSGMPRNVLSGTVLPSEYTIMRALSERQSSLSVARCIRDAIGTTDSDAREIRNSLIRRGWMTNDASPALTEVGLSVLD